MELTTISAKVDRICALKKQQEAVKEQIDVLEGEFLKLCEDDLTDTKVKSISYFGTGKNKVTATVASNVKVIYPSFLRRVFGDCYKDVITEETTYKISAPAKRMLAGLYLKNYTKMTVAEVLKEIAPDEKTFAALVKKVKGANCQGDKKYLMSIAGLGEREAEEYAYFIAEAAVWESYTKLLSVNDMGEAAADEQLRLIDGAVVAEETPKITIEC